MDNTCIDKCWCCRTKCHLVYLDVSLKPSEERKLGGFVSCCRDLFTKSLSGVGAAF